LVSDEWSVKNVDEYLMARSRQKQCRRKQRDLSASRPQDLIAGNERHGELRKPLMDNGPIADVEVSFEERNGSR
jgi:hypothetical protein